MSRASPYSVRDQVLTLLQTLTQKQAASRLGVSERTVRRWKNEESRYPRVMERAPVQPRAQVRPVIAKEANRARKAITINNRRVVGKLQPAPANIPVPPRAGRRVLRVYKNGLPVRGAYKESSWVNYDVRKSTIASMLALIRTVAGKDFRVQLIFSTNRDPYTREVLSERRHGGSPIEAALLLRDDAAILDFLNEHFFQAGRRPLYIAIHDRVPPPSKRKGKKK